MHQCTLCNEYIDEVEMEFGEVLDIDGEFWHGECYAEYFGEVLESV